MYKNQKNKLQAYSLFIKIFIVMCVSAILISLLTSFVTIRMSEKLFIETFSMTNNKIVNQVESNFDAYGQAVSMTLNQIQQNRTIYNFLTDTDDDSLAMSKAYYQIHTQLKTISPSLNQYPINLVLTGENNRMYAIKNTYWSVTEKDLHESFLSKEAKKRPNVIRYHYLNNEMTENEGMILSVKALNERIEDQVYGIVYISMKEKDFRKMYANYTREGNDFIVLDNQGNIISSNRDEWIGRKEGGLFLQAQTAEQNMKAYEKVKWDDKDYLMVTKQLPVYDMQIVNLVDREMLQQSLINTKAVFIISLLIVGIALTIVFFILRKMTKSLSNLVKEISNLAQKNFNQNVTVTGSYETRELAKTFNHMLKELRVYVDKLLETERKQRTAELSALQRQINPHFLYNTLTSIKILVEHGEMEKSTETIHALISLLQNTIGHAGEMVTVEEEMKSMEHYVYINRIRYGERIKVHSFIAPGCLYYEIPKLIIQPFVENAFFHGFNKKPTGFIQILISKDDTSLICEIIDNGDGMIIEKGIPSNEKHKRQLFHGIGVKNVHERIQLLYGECYGVELHSEIGEGTKIKIKLPLINNIHSSIGKVN